MQGQSRCKEDSVFGTLQAHAAQLAADARDLEQVLAESDATSLPPLVVAVTGVDLAKARAELAKASDLVLAHAVPRG